MASEMPQIPSHMVPVALHHPASPYLCHCFRIWFLQSQLSVPVPFSLQLPSCFFASEWLIISCDLFTGVVKYV